MSDLGLDAVLSRARGHRGSRPDQQPRGARGQEHRQRREQGRDTKPTLLVFLLRGEAPEQRPGTGHQGQPPENPFAAEILLFPFYF